MLYICETCLIVHCAKQFDGGDGVYDNVVPINNLFQKNCGPCFSKGSDTKTLLRPHVKGH